MGRDSRSETYGFSPGTHSSLRLTDQMVAFEAMLVFQSEIQHRGARTVLPGEEFAPVDLTCWSTELTDLALKKTMDDFSHGVIKPLVRMLMRTLDLMGLGRTTELWFAQPELSGAVSSEWNSEYRVTSREGTSLLYLKKAVPGGFRIGLRILARVVPVAASHIDATCGLMLESARGSL